MEEKIKSLKTNVLFVVNRISNEDQLEEQFVLQQIVFKDRNSLCRFGEILTVMNGAEAFDIYDVTDVDKPALDRVCLEPYDQDVQHPFTESIEEDLDKDTSASYSAESNS